MKSCVCVKNQGCKSVFRRCVMSSRTGRLPEYSFIIDGLREASRAIISDAPSFTKSFICSVCDASSTLHAVSSTITTEPDSMRMTRSGQILQSKGLCVSSSMQPLSLSRNGHGAYESEPCCSQYAERSYVKAPPRCSTENGPYDAERVRSSFSLNTGVSHASDLRKVQQNLHDAHCCALSTGESSDFIIPQVYHDSFLMCTVFILRYMCLRPLHR